MFRHGEAGRRLGILIQKIKGWAPLALASPYTQLLDWSQIKVWTPLAGGQVVPSVVSYGATT